MTLLKYIQIYSPQTIVGLDGIACGLRQYASRYFLKEIRDELDGYLLGSEIHSLMLAFGQLRDELFRVEGLRRRADKGLQDRLPRMLRDLFNCGVIGNWEEQDRVAQRTFRYKFPDSRLDLEGKMVIHPALGIAFNAKSAEDTDPSDSGELELQRLARGGVIKVSTPGGYGRIQSDDGWIYQYQTHNVIGNPGVRLCEGDRVAFEPLTRERLARYRKGIHPFPELTEVRYTPTLSDRVSAARAGVSSKR